MGMIRIETKGSFPRRERNFSALGHGHAQAVTAAITFLSTEVLPAAIEQDHELQKQGHAPEDGKFGKYPLAKF